MLPRTILALLICVGTVNAAEGEKERVLFDFKDVANAKPWRSVNDGVMGGRSQGRMSVTEDKNMAFSGRLSLENNGGFSSVRTQPVMLNLQKGDSILLRVRGDGREYSFNLYVPRRFVAFSYRATFKTKKDKWIDVELPLDKFVATSFGRIVRNQPLDATEVNGLGILLGDKKAGPFRLDIESISVKSP